MTLGTKMGTILPFGLQIWSNISMRIILMVNTERIDGMLTLDRLLD